MPDEPSVTAAPSLRRILIVEDDSLLRDSLVASLQRAGHEPAAVADGDEAIQELKRQTFDLVLLDIFLPRKSGFDVVNHIRSRCLRIKIVVMSAGGSLLGARDYLATMKLMSVDGVLQKPFNHAELLSKITTVLLPPEPSKQLD